jgi:hypothetical protein
MVVVVRRDSLTARPATSVDLLACAAISLMDEASSSTEVAAVVTFSDAAATRPFRVARFRRHRVGGFVEFAGRRLKALRGAAHLAEHVLDRFSRSVRS